MWTVHTVRPGYKREHKYLNGGKSVETANTAQSAGDFVFFLFGTHGNVLAGVIVEIIDAKSSICPLGEGFQWVSTKPCSLVWRRGQRIRSKLY